MKETREERGVDREAVTIVTSYVNNVTVSASQKYVPGKLCNLWETTNGGRRTACPKEGPQFEATRSRRTRVSTSTSRQRERLP